MRTLTRPVPTITAITVGLSMPEHAVISPDSLKQVRASNAAMYDSIDADTSDPVNAATFALRFPRLGDNDWDRFEAPVHVENALAAALSQGWYDVSYRRVDRVGNEEISRTMGETAVVVANVTQRQNPLRHDDWVLWCHREALRHLRDAQRELLAKRGDRLLGTWGTAVLLVTEGMPEWHQNRLYVRVPQGHVRVVAKHRDNRLPLAEFNRQLAALLEPVPEF